VGVPPASRRAAGPASGGVQLLEHDRASSTGRRERIRNLGTAVNVMHHGVRQPGETQRHRRGVHRTASASRRVRRLPGQAQARTWSRDPQHPVAGCSRRWTRRRHKQLIKPCGAGDPLPGPVRHRVHHRARQLWILQTRVGQTHRGGRSGRSQLVDEQLITLDEALVARCRRAAGAADVPRFDPPPTGSC